ncbi:MAG: molybdopterin molybdotransferase MoeA [Helicobacteraceae bacterium]|nr:molybdopterin molybdotransferase MoeA [Helicobacteraceae bacterium]
MDKLQKLIQSSNIVKKNKSIKIRELNDYLQMLYKLKVKPKDSKEVPLSKAMGRILSENIICRYSIPRFDNSAMDGYAIRLGYEKYEIKGNILAGSMQNLAIKDNQAYRIMTGARIPNNTEAIIQQELVEVRDNILIPKVKVLKNQCIKFSGEDFKSKEILLKKGNEIDAQAIGILASQGFETIKVRKKVKIVIFGSGNEVSNIGTKLNDFQIYDLNSYFLKAFLGQLNCSIKYGGVLGDDEKKIESSLKEASKKYDIIITSGGVSVGDADYMHKVLKNLNAEILQDSINIKPGKPLILSKLNEKFILSLPGNPIGAFLQAFFCIPILIQKFSEADFYLKPSIALNAVEFKVSQKTSHIILGNLQNSKFSAYNSAKYQGSQVAPLLKSNAIAIFNNIDLVKKDKKILVFSFNLEFLDKMQDTLNQG